MAAALLALATVATAWSGYQASRWNGEQAKAFSRAGALRIESTKAADLANAQTQVDIATFTSWADAYAGGNTMLSDFYYARFRPEFRPAMDAWVATRPLVTPDAPLTPFVMPEYQLAARAEADELAAQAEVSSAAARLNIQRATNYVLCVVLFAAVLFFAGMSSKFDSQRARRIVLGIGLVLFVGATLWLVTLPVSFAV